MTIKSGNPIGDRGDLYLHVEPVDETPDPRRRATDVRLSLTASSCSEYYYC